MSRSRPPRPTLHALVVRRGRNLAKLRRTRAPVLFAERSVELLLEFSLVGDDVLRLRDEVSRRREERTQEVLFARHFNGTLCQVYTIPHAFTASPPSLSGAAVGATLPFAASLQRP